MNYYIAIIISILTVIAPVLGAIAVDSHIITIDTFKYGAIAIVAVFIPFIIKAIYTEIKDLIIRQKEIKYIMNNTKHDN